MAVKVQRDPDLAVPQPLARYLGVNPQRERVRGMSVAQIVESNSRPMAVHLEEANPFLSDAVAPRCVH